MIDFHVQTAWDLNFSCSLQNNLREGMLNHNPVILFLSIQCLIEQKPSLSKLLLVNHHTALLTLSFEHLSIAGRDLLYNKSQGSLYREVESYSGEGFNTDRSEYID